jgi:2-methylcitrate dehydratase PrpD
MSIAQELAERIVTCRYDDLPAAAVSWATQAITDTIGCTFADSCEPIARIPAQVENRNSKRHFRAAPKASTKEAM